MLGIEDSVFVGGATISLYLTDSAAPEPRYTFDVDLITPVASRRAYHALEARLRDAGHQPDPSGPICRWLIDGIQVDLMPPYEDILGFSNRWYEGLVAHAQSLVLPDNTPIKYASTPYLLATKLEAFSNRGHGSYVESPDLEDIIIVLDGREEVVAELGGSPEDVRTYVATTFGALLDTQAFLEALPGHLMPDAASQARADIILKRMETIRYLKGDV